MRVSETTFAAHGAALLEAAARLFRKRGLESVTVAEVAKAAGLTHGAFYGHYESKAALAEAACRQSLSQGAARWRARAASHPEDPLGAIIDAYLTERHRDAPESGCALAAIGPEAARDTGELSAALDEGTRDLLDALEDAIARMRPNLPAPGRADTAAAVLAILVGGLVVARALRPDAERSRAALSAARAAARGLLPPTES